MPSVPRNDWNSAVKHLLAATPLADRAFLVPHHPPRQRPELAEHLEMAAEHVVGLTGRDHPPADRTGRSR